MAVATIVAVITIVVVITEAVITAVAITVDAIIVAAITAAITMAITAAMVIIILIAAGSGTAIGTHTASVRAGVGRHTTTSSSGSAVDRLDALDTLTSGHTRRPRLLVRGLFLLPAYRYFQRPRISYPQATRFHPRPVTCSPTTFSENGSNKR